MSEKSDDKSATVNVIEIDKICRACLGEVQNNYFGFESFYKDRKFSDIYTNVISAEFKSEDSLPKKICTNCYNQIIKFDVFKSKVLESEKILGNLLKSKENNFEGYQFEGIEIIYKSEDEWSNHNFNNVKDESEDEVKTKPNRFVNIEYLKMSEKSDDKSATVTEIEIDKICRACLGDVHNNYFGFESFYKDRKFSDIYTNVTSAEFKSEDSLPKKICANCYNQVVMFDVFKSKVLESEKILGNLLKPKENNFEGYDIEGIEIIYKSEDEWSNHNFNDLKDENEDEVPLSDRFKLGNDHEYASFLTDQLSNNKYNNTVLDESELPKPKRFVQIKTTKISVEKTGGKKKVRRKGTCKHCGKLLLTSRMSGHIRTHTKEKPFSCEKCGMCFSEKTNLARHLKIHGEIMPHTCEMCGKGFLGASGLAVHQIAAHRTAEEIFCTFCGRNFKHKFFLNRHIANVHENKNPKPSTNAEKREFKCNICGNLYSSRSSLNGHILRHQVPKRYLCNVCGNGYSTKAVLRHHEMVHTGEKNYSCKVCEKRFRFYSSLKTHQLVHTGEKPLTCHICDKNFRQHAHLKTHIKGQHTSDRPYECTYCHKTFKQSYNLVLHTRIHTGETPHLCDICGKGFYNSSNLKKHKKGHPELEMQHVELQT